MRVSKVGRYTLIAELAQGGMGTVHLGVARGLAGFSKLMVIKQLRPELAEDRSFLGMFLDEARLAARLNHPNVVQTTEVGSEGNTHYLAMEFLDGQSLQRLRTRVGQRGEFPLALHVSILIDVLHGLHYAHELRDLDGTPLMIVHRDVSPHNVFVTYDGQVKVVDFGIAKAVDSSLETRTGELKGKVAYMPPEQASQQKVDRRADVFAVGVMLWEAIAQRRMWHGMNEMAIMHQLMMGSLPSIREACPTIDAELERVVTRAIAQRVEERYATAEALAHDLDAWLARTNQRPSPRDVGRLVQSSFEQDREELRRVIERQMKILQETPDSSAPSTYEPVDLTRGVAPTGTTSFANASSVAAQPKPFPVALALGGVFVALLLAGGIFALSITRAKPAPSAAATASTPASTTATTIANTTTSTTTQADDRVTLSLSADPPSARFFVDDTPVEGNPYTGPYKRDGLTHRVRVEAAGYETERLSVVFDRDVARTATLKKRATSAPTKPTAPAAPPSTDGKRAPRELDTSYPR